jgi:hypothetical protein
LEVSLSRPAAVLLALGLLASGCTEDGARGPTEIGEPGTPLTRSDRPPCRNLNELVQRVKRGYVPRKGTQITFIPREPNYVGTAERPVHSGPWDYLAHVPLVLYGPGVVKSSLKLEQHATMADLAPTTAELIGFDDFPARDGRVLTRSFEPDAPRPRLVVSLVWDGAGWNVLNAHKESWPYYESLMEQGVLYDNFDIGSSPSVTPPVHTTLGTGAWPFHHGVHSLRVRTRDEYLESFYRIDPSIIEIPTLADLYDRALDNRPVTGIVATLNWHLGMVGHGLATPGGDADPALLLHEGGDIFGNADLFDVPVNYQDAALLQAFERQVDRADGEADGKWRGLTLEGSDSKDWTPATVAYQQRLIERFVTGSDMGADAVPDLLYVNFKAADSVGHVFGMNSPPVSDIIEAQDAALKRLVRFLNRRVGAGRWVLMVTADHGQTPYPEQSGAWPIAGGELGVDANAALDKRDNGVDLVDRVSAVGAYINMGELRANRLSLPKVARWFAGYTVAENLKDGEKLPSRFRGREEEPLFDAIVARRDFVAVACRPKQNS